MPEPGLLNMLGQGADSYGGRTLGQVVSGGNPYSLGDYRDRQDEVNWQNQLANNQNVSMAIGSGATYQPDIAKSLFSSGPEGGWFANPGAGGANESVYNPEISYYKNNPAPGLMGMSTNNWRLLPQGYQSPGFNMRSGHVLQRHYEGKPMQYASDRGAEAPWGIGGPGHGFPVSQGSSNQRGYFFPGQIEPWIYEGGPGIT